MGPLGPLGDNVEAFPSVDEPPVPPQKEQAGRTQHPPASASGQSSLRTMMDSVNLDDDDGSTRPKQPPPVQPPMSANGAAQRQTQPSMSVLEAARPTFNVAVGDPHKVGDLTSSHTEYSVRTKVKSPNGMSVYGVLLTQIHYRLRQKPTATPNSPSPAATEISFGSITSSTIIAPASSFLHLPKNKPWVASMQTLSSHGGKRLSGCSIRLQHIQYYRMTAI